MPFALADGVKLYYEETGAGESVVFVHEFSGDLRSWEPQVRHFCRKYRCVTFNARGYPPSDIPEDLTAFSQERAVDDILAIMDHLELDQAHVVGLSMGAFATLDLGLHHPDRTASLVVAACGYGATPVARGYAQWEEEVEEFASTLERGNAEAWRTHATAPGRVPFREKDPRGWAQFATQLAEHSPIAAANTLRGVQKNRQNLYDLKSDLTSLTVPTLILSGDEDEPCLEPAIFLKRTIPSAGLCILPKTGHTINLEEPALFNQLVEDFLDTVRLSRWRIRESHAQPTDIMGHSAARMEPDT